MTSFTGVAPSGGGFFANLANVKPPNATVGLKLAKPEDEEDDEGEDDPNYNPGNESPEADPSKSAVQYTYEENSDRIISVNCTDLHGSSVLAAS